MFWKKWRKKKQSPAGSITVGMKITPCNNCSKFNVGVKIYNLFSWGPDASCAMGYDKETHEILLAEEQLMHVIQMVNPIQQPRKIRLIGQEELWNRK